MTLEQFARAFRYWAPPLAVAAVCLTLAACGGGSEEQYFVSERQRTAGATIDPNTLETGLKVAGFPHAVDVYRPAHATRAIVFLHGQGGRNYLSAYDLGVNRKPVPANARNVDWRWLQAHGVIAVFPQGQAAPGSAHPGWNNWVFDSGQDDVAFLQALAAHLRTAYGATEVVLAGHSSGGAMTARMWCEATGSFRAFVSLASPMPNPDYPTPGPMCTPRGTAPYFAVIGGRDSKLPKFFAGAIPPTPAQIAVGLTQNYLVYEWKRHEDRGLSDCGIAPVLEPGLANSNAITWRACEEMLRYTVVPQADHTIASLEAALGAKAVDLLAGFALSH